MMKWVLLITLALLIVLFILLFIKLKVIIDYYHGNDNDHLKITVEGLLGLFKYRIDVPVIKVDEDSPSLVMKEKTELGQKEKDQTEGRKQISAEDLLRSMKDAKELLKHVVGLYKIVRQFFKKVAVEYLEWHTVVGVGDAAYTGIIAGAFWTVKGSLLGLLSNYMKLKQLPVVTITPSFQGTISQTSFKCMIRFRIGHAIFAGIKLIKFWKGGRPHFKTKPLSILSGDKTKSTQGGKINV
jgi:hypothetical protein